MADLAKNEAGVFMTVLGSGANLSEKAMGVPLGVTRTIRDELFRATFAGVDWVEGVQQSSFKVLREMLQRMDKLSQEAVDGLDAVTGAVSRTIRGSGEAAGMMVSRTAASLTGTKEPSQAMPAASA
jgi:hypothetical protein